jgi:methionyl-tRNA synthetase
MNNTLFVSTAIPYVNAPPHLGFALEVLLADVLARHGRARGEDVHFVTGTDDNSLSNVRAAEASKVTTRELVDSNAARYRALDRVLDASFDDFIRTSVDERHVAAVNALWAACEARGDLERRPYRGVYCVGCEQFLDPDELEQGACPEHRVTPELVEEENWFFRLSRYEATIRDAFASGRIRIEPPERAREVERLLEKGLRDVSVSRSRVRARGWGIPVPGDAEQVIWVWFDALANYLTTLGYPSNSANEGRLRFWSNGGRRVHVIGKGITRFHAAIWPALLLAAELPLPTTLWVHGYVTVDGQKIGKSRGNAIDPESIIRRFGVDGLRYFLLRHVGAAKDADIDQTRLETVYRSELADDLGNLLARTTALLRTQAIGSVRSLPTTGIDPSGEVLAEGARTLGERVDDAVERFAPDDALREIWGVVSAANKHLAVSAPWTLAKDAANAPRVRAILEHAAFALECIGHALVPFLPTTANAIASALADPTKRAPVLFPKEDQKGTPVP